MSKYNLILLLAVLSLPANGQLLKQNDTVRIEEVVITGKQHGSLISGFNKIVIDSGVMMKYSHESLASLLSDYSPVFFKSYGAGGISTPSFRGTGATHTQITWNGININHPMLGQSDFSLIPAGMIDNVEIFPGNSAMELNSGGFGGIINLSNEPDWNNRTGFAFSPEIGSFGRWSGYARIKSGNDRFQTVTKLYLHSADNNFRFLDAVSTAEPSWVTRKNSEVKQKGFLQEFYLKKSGNVASVRLWYQSASRNLPAPVIARQTSEGEKQADESFRVMLNFNKSGRRTDYFLTSAGIFSKLSYSNQVASIESDNIARSVLLRGGLETMLGEFTRVRLILNDDLHLIESNNYQANAARNTVFLTLSAERNVSDRFGTFILVREIIDNKNLLLPDFSSGFDFRLFPGKNYFLKANVARNSKIPAMNDMHWYPGGNPDLKNEYSLSCELIFSADHKFWESLKLRQDITFFGTSIRNMIQWQPGEYTYWTAKNIRSVNTSGIETSANAVYTGRILNLALNVNYSYTKAVELNSQNSENEKNSFQLIYVPRNLARTSLRIGFQKYYVTFVTNFTGRRYITVDNSEYLPGYAVSDIVSGIRINRSNTIFDMSFSVENLLNAEYQTIAYYPQPGRSFLIRLMLQFNKGV